MTYLVCAWEWATAQKPAADGVALGWAIAEPVDHANLSAFRAKHAHPGVWADVEYPTVQRRRDEIVRVNG